MSDVHNAGEPDRDREERLSTADIAGASRQSAAPMEARTFDQAESGQGAAPSDIEAGPLFPVGEADTFRRRWTTIQSGFVDEPRRAVEEADGMVAETIKRLAEMFSDERAGLERQWDRGDNVSTEDLRVALQRYRSFFTRLLSV